MIFVFIAKKYNLGFERLSHFLQSHQRLIEIKGDMGILDKIFKNTGHLTELRKLISKEYVIKFHEDQLNDMFSRKSVSGFVKEHGISNPSFKIDNDQLYLEGRRKAAGVSFGFSIALAPEVVWGNHEHSLVFRFEGQPARHENFFCFLLAAIISEFSDGIAKDHVYRKPEIIFNDNLMIVRLDGVHSDFQSIITSMEVAEVSCRNKNILIKFKILPSQAFKNPILILSLMRKMK